MKIITVLLLVLLMDICLVIAQEMNGFDLSDTSVPSNEIIYEGYPRDGIPSLDHPRFVLAKDMNELKADDRVLGITYNGFSKAYPVRILNFHEVVNDMYGDQGVVITYCPMCGSGMAFKANFPTGKCTFGEAGLVYNSDFLMYDRESESLWCQFLMEAISGPMKGSKLEIINIHHTSWADWLKTHPESSVLSFKTTFDLNYSNTPYDDYEDTDSIYFPVANKDERLKPKEWVIGFENKGQAKAYPFTKLEKSKMPLHDTIGGKPVEIIYDDRSRCAMIKDISGEELPTVTAYWFAWAAFHPKTEIFLKN